MKILQDKSGELFLCQKDLKVWKCHMPLVGWESTAITDEPELHDIWTAYDDVSWNVDVFIRIGEDIVTPEEFKTELDFAKDLSEKYKWKLIKWED